MAILKSNILYNSIYMTSSEYQNYAQEEEIGVFQVEEMKSGSDVIMEEQHIE